MESLNGIFRADLICAALGQAFATPQILYSKVLDLD